MSDTPAPAKTIALTFPLTEKAGDWIGRYKLLQPIGEGGCGVVYMAEQQEPVTRRVALKVIKLGMDTKSVVARFEAERQALAMMDHPNIAKVLDAGATETGRPFFVMELVRGIKITDYCDQNKLPIPERLQLFSQVCQAIQHAHQKGIIHRDIKPSNILVTLHDGVPVPKVIDFGIAKATQGRLTDQTLFTAFKQFIGTPAYMSPEQAEMSGLDIDTRCDVYALGVLLYELLTGQTPFDARELLASGLDKMRQTIREREPERPSMRLRTMLGGEAAAAVPVARAQTIGLLRGDLDWIVMKALEKDRTRRYDTAIGMAKDIQRYLRNEPVDARPPGGFYRFHKLIRRNKLAFVAGSAVMLALVLGLGASIYLYVLEREARQRADASETIKDQLLRESEIRGQFGEKIGLAALYLTQGKIEESEKEIRLLPFSSITNYVTLAPLFNAYAERDARLGAWRAAISNYDDVTVIVPSDFPAYPALASLYAQAGDREGWRRDCEQMLHQFAGTDDPVIATRIAEESLILPPPSSDFDDIGKMVNIALTANSPHKSWDDVYFVKGLLEYRLGNSAGALEGLNKVRKDNGSPKRDLAVEALTALAQYRLGHASEAQAALSNAMQTARTKMENPAKGLERDWNDWTVVHQLMDEAQALIQPKTSVEAK